MRVAIGSDHRGYQAKEKIKAMLVSKGYDVLDFGADCASSCDYPDAAYPTCKSVVTGVSDFAILLCGSGIGMCISANKVRGIRAALCHDELTAEMSRRHNDANVLCLAADLIGEELMRRIVDVWLNTAFEGGRHERRVKKIAFYEDKEHEGDPPRSAPDKLKDV
ncbi:MAG TPA: ribose 5-phosphate isomerase B [Phycisphaerae bacterium]|nr:ribose 5-phosphate isomerase B [Phycisphaerae bacterium]HOJ73541.1 ribose 5-phosphate isomerase B [Phycisphaerae bacterium]HOM51651.1 ribose 5-phosphate isomerase B [Phycisphaerae bacterium]HON65512.1 ribose 5-phosphate isomerase B [Phycisphaerae bacterium]HOQ86430.1 ribose 5-phosphate isomerase B [Phycisphaerae bacterium]